MIPFFFFLFFCYFVSFCFFFLASFVGDFQKSTQERERREREGEREKERERERERERESPCLFITSDIQFQIFERKEIIPTKTAKLENQLGTDQFFLSFPTLWKFTLETGSHFFSKLWNSYAWIYQFLLEPTLWKIILTWSKLQVLVGWTLSKLQVFSRIESSVLLLIYFYVIDLTARTVAWSFDQLSSWLYQITPTFLLSSPWHIITYLSPHTLVWSIQIHP